MRVRRRPKVEAPASGVLPKSGDRIAWYDWRMRDKRRTAAHAFKVAEGVRCAKALCHNAPGTLATDVREVERPVERCLSCSGALARLSPRGSAVAARIGTRVPGPSRVDPRTVYTPTFGYDDFERELRYGR